jgi:hypothetical protein
MVFQDQKNVLVKGRLFGESHHSHHESSRIFTYFFKHGVKGSDPNIPKDPHGQRFQQSKNSTVRGQRCQTFLFTKCIGITVKDRESSYWWQLVAIGGNWWQLVAIGGNWWQLVAIGMAKSKRKKNRWG